MGIFTTNSTRLETSTETGENKKYSTVTVVDPTNQPSQVILNGYTLPENVQIVDSNGKIIAETKILDGVMVYERVSRLPMDITFEFTFREINTGQYPNSPLNKYVFPQKMIENFNSNVWQKDQTIEVKNSYLNGLGILYLILKDVTKTTIRGNTDVLCSIKCKEVVNNSSQQNTLIITP